MHGHGGVGDGVDGHLGLDGVGGRGRRVVVVGPLVGDRISHGGRGGVEGGGRERAKT